MDRNRKQSYAAVVALAAFVAWFVALRTLRKVRFRCVDQIGTKFSSLFEQTLETRWRLLANYNSFSDFVMHQISEKTSVR